jgi:hypothetical protein
MRTLGFTLFCLCCLSCKQESQSAEKAETADAVAPTWQEQEAQRDQQNPLASAASIYRELVDAYAVLSGKEECVPCTQLVQQERRAQQVQRGGTDEHRRTAYSIKSAAIKECWGHFDGYETTRFDRYHERVGRFSPGQHQVLYRLLQKGLVLLRPCRAKLCHLAKDNIRREAEGKCNALGVVLLAVEKALKQAGAFKEE